MPFRSPPLLIPGGFGRKICIESESGLVTIRKGRGMKNISGSESESNWSGSVHTLRNSVRQRTEDRTFSKKWVHCLLKLDETSIWKGVGCLYSGISSRIGFFLQLDSFSRGWRTFPHFSERSLIFWMRGIFHSLLLDDRSMMEEDDRISKKGKGKRVLELLKVKIKKKKKQKGNSRSISIVIEAP